MEANFFLLHVHTRISHFMVLAVMACCLRLFGPVTFNAKMRARVSGIGKVPGAGASGIQPLLNLKMCTGRMKRHLIS